MRQEIKSGAGGRGSGKSVNKSDFRRAPHISLPTPRTRFWHSFVILLAETRFRFLSADVDMTLPFIICKFAEVIRKGRRKVTRGHDDLTVADEKYIWLETESSTNITF